MDDRPLLLTDDPELLDDWLRLAATAGVAVQHAVDPGSAGLAWTRAPLVVADPRLAPGLGRLPRHPALVLAGAGAGDDAAYRVAVEVGAVQVLWLPLDEDLLVERLSRVDRVGAAGPVLGVVGGRGGAGASTLAAALAVTAARQGEAVLVDADPVGGGLDLVLGAEHVPGSRWADLAHGGGRISSSAVTASLPVAAGVRVLSCGREVVPSLSAPAVEAVLAACRDSGAVTVVDLPRGGLAEPWVATLVAGCDQVVLLVPEELRAVAAARQVAARLAGGPPVRLVTRGPAPGGLSPAAVARALGLEPGGRLRPEPGLGSGLELGTAPAVRGRGPLAGLCRLLLDELPNRRVLT